MTCVTATLFDFDGVLVDSEPVHLAAFNDVLASRGVHIDEATYARRYMSLDDAGVFRAALAESGRPPPDDEVRALVDEKSPRFLARFAASFVAYPGAAETVLRRAARGPVGIVSGALRGEIAFALEKMGLASQVSFIVSAERTTASKPDPEPYRVALQELRLLGHQGGAVVIEDSIGGVTSAKCAGLRCVAVAHSYPRAELERAGADAVVADLASVTDELLEADV